MKKRKHNEYDRVKTTITKQTIVTTLKCKQVTLRTCLKAIQRNVSEAMTLSTKLGSLVVLERIRNNEPIYDFYFGQTFFRWCVEAVTTLNGKMSKMKIGKYSRRKSKPKPKLKRETEEDYNLRLLKNEQNLIDKHKATKIEKQIIKPHLYKVLNQVKQNCPSFKDLKLQDRAYLSGFFEPLYKQYETNIKVYIATTLEKRMTKVLKGQILTILNMIKDIPKKDKDQVHGILLGYLFNNIKGKESPNWQERRRHIIGKYFTDEIWLAAKAVVVKHRSYLPTVDKSYGRNLEFKSVGIFGSKYIQSHALQYLPYLGYLATLTTNSFCILPQWNAKARHIQLNRASLRSLFIFSKNKLKIDPITWLNNTDSYTNFLDSKKKDLTTWNKCFSDQAITSIFSDLFVFPRINTRKQFGNSMMTDLVKASFTIDSKVQIVKSDKKQKLSKDLNLSTIKNGLYYHGDEPEENRFIEDKKMNWVFIDPGHVNLMYGIRENNQDDFDPKLAERYKLGNKEYRTITGMRKRQKITEFRINEKELDAKEAFEDLSNNSSKSWDPGIYMEHIKCVINHWIVLFRHAFQPYQRIYRFQNYQAKQRIIKKIATDLGQGKSNTIIVVGNGVSSATSRGHDSAPGKGLRKLLSYYLPIIMTSERFTTKRSACCTSSVHYGHYDSQSKRSGYRIRGLYHCNNCNMILDRDRSAALNIRKLFRFQMSNRTTINNLENVLL